MSIPVIGLGAGGHARVIIDILLTMGNFKIISLLDNNEKFWGRKVAGIPVLGSDSMLEKYNFKNVKHAFIGVGSIGNAKKRVELFQKLSSYSIVSAIHPLAYISNTAEIGYAVTIMPKAIINTNAIIGENVIINSAAVIEHDCKIADHVHISPGVLLAGGVRVGEKTHVGIGATVIENISIGNSCIIGAGAVVINDVPDNTCVVGVPAHKVRKSKK